MSRVSRYIVKNHLRPRIIRGSIKRMRRRENPVQRIMQKWRRKGGRARAKNIRAGKTAEELSAYMRRVANARWAKVREARKSGAAA